MENSESLSFWIEAAKRINTKSAKIHDYRIRSRRKRMLRDLAKELTESKGYILATEKEMRTKYPYGFRYDVSDTKLWPIKDNKLHIWAVHTSLPDKYGRVDFSLVAVY